MAESFECVLHNEPLYSQLGVKTNQCFRVWRKPKLENKTIVE